MPGFFLVTAGEPFIRRLGVRQRGGRVFEPWDAREEESSTTSASTADRQLWSELLNRLRPCAEDSVPSTGKQTQDAGFSPSRKFLVQVRMFCGLASGEYAN